MSRKKNTFIVLSVFLVKERGFCNKNIAQMGSWVDWYKRIHFFDISFFRGNITFLAFSTTPSLSQGCTFFTTWSGMTNCFSILKKNPGGRKGKFLVFPSIARNVQHTIGLNAKTLNTSIASIMGTFAIAWEIFHERYFQLSKSHHKKFEFQGKKI